MCNLNLVFLGAVVSWSAIQNPCYSQDATMPPIWEQIRAEAKMLPQFLDKEHFAESRIAAQRIASQYDRGAIKEILIEQLRSPVASYSGDPELFGPYKLSEHVIAEIVDADGEHGIKASLRPNSQSNHAGLTGFAALASIGDEASLDVLFQIVLEKGDFAFLKDKPTSHSGVAIQMLRGYEISEPRYNQLKALLLKEEEKVTKQYPVSWRFSPHCYRKTQVDYLLAAMSSIEFANGIPSNEEKEKYRNFQSRLWTGYAISPKGSRNGNTAPKESARFVEERWETGDHFFLEEMFNDPASTITELDIACFLVHLDPRQEEKYLKILANSPSPNSYYAKMALKALGYRVKITSESVGDSGALRK